MADVQKPKAIDFEVNMEDEESILAGAKEVFSRALPEWDVEKIEMKTMSGGLTNILLRCHYVPESERLVLRIYGKNTEGYINREAGLRNMIILNHYNLAPKIYFTFTNGVCFGYFEGKDLEHTMVYDRGISSQIAKLMARMHTIPIDSESEACVYPMVKKFAHLSSQELVKKIEQELEKEFGKPVDLYGEIKQLDSLVKSLESDIVFCHNDLLMANIIQSDDELHFIDYEYAAPNYQAFDIGNHFCEFGSLLFYDRSRYPSKEYQLEWIRIYLTEYRLLKSLSIPTEEDVERLYKEANKCALLSSLIWGFWSVLQEQNSSIDFCFHRFAEGRFGMYLERKDEFFHL